ncbi:spermatogenesis associated protein 5 [Phlyctochytrium planicorne]|nr:spermatogenesis associated protein 5 [Phlyctochytrium planicorne]
MRQLNFPATMITPHTVYRTSMIANEEKDKQQPTYKYRVLAGPDMFDTKTEAIVLFPELLNPMNDPSFKMLAGLGGGQANAAAIAAAMGGAAKTGAAKPAAATAGAAAGKAPAAGAAKAPAAAAAAKKKKDEEEEEEPTTPFSHKEYDKGEFIKQFELKLRTVLAELSDESAGRDPNAAVFKRIICECFLPWAISGFTRRPAGILLHGPPGNGKSFMVDTYIREKLDLEMTNMDYASSRFSSGKVGEGEAKMRKEAGICKRNRQKLYCMFIDEIDTVGGDRNLAENAGYKTDYLNQLLAIIGQRGYQNLFVVGATNYKDRLDAALIRDGRLEKHYYLPSMDKNRRLDHLSKKLANAFTSVFRNSLPDDVKITAYDVRRNLEANKPVMGFLLRNTVNFTFAQFDRLCSDIESYMRIYFWSGSLDSVAAISAWLPDIVQDGFHTKDKKLVLLAKDKMITSCLDGTVKIAIDTYFKGNSMENLAYNRVALDSTGVSVTIEQYLTEVRSYIAQETRYHSGLAPPTGRFIMNLSSARNGFPELQVEVARNPILQRLTNFTERRIPCRNVFFNDRLMSKMLQPLVTSRSYEFIQIIERETTQVDEEDKLYGLLKAKYEEAATLAQNGTAGLIIVRLSDLIGHIIQINTTKRTILSTRTASDDVRSKDNTATTMQRENTEELQRLMEESQMREALDFAFRQHLINSMESHEAFEFRQQFQNDVVQSRAEKSTESEREMESQDQTQRESDTQTQRSSEFHSIIDRNIQRLQKDRIDRLAKSMSNEQRVGTTTSQDSGRNKDRGRSTNDTTNQAQSTDNTNTTNNQNTRSRDNTSSTSNKNISNTDNTRKTDNTSISENSNTHTDEQGRRIEDKDEALRQRKQDNTQTQQDVDSLARQNQKISSDTDTDTRTNTNTDQSQDLRSNQNQKSNSDTNTVNNQNQQTQQQQDLSSQQRQHQTGTSDTSTQQSQQQQQDQRSNVHSDATSTNSTSTQNHTDQNQHQNVQSTQDQHTNSNTNTSNNTQSNQQTSSNQQKSEDTTGFEDKRQHQDKSENLSTSGTSSQHTRNNGKDDAATNQDVNSTLKDGSGSKTNSSSDMHSQNSSNGHTNSNTNTNSNQNSNTQTNTNAQTDSNSRTNSNSNINTNSSTDTNTNSNSRANTATDTNTNTSTNSNTDTNSRARQNQTSDTNTNTNSNTNTNTNLDSTARSNEQKNSDTNTRTNQHQNQNTNDLSNSKAKEHKNSDINSTTQLNTNTNTNSSTNSNTNSNTNTNTNTGFRNNTDSQSATDRNTNSQSQSSSESEQRQRIADQAASEAQRQQQSNSRDASQKNSQSASQATSNTTNETETERINKQQLQSKTKALTTTQTQEDVNIKSQVKEKADEKRREQERTRLRQQAQEQSLRHVMDQERNKLLEQGLSEEYRKAMGQEITNRQMLQNEQRNLQELNNNRMEAEERSRQRMNTYMTNLEKNVGATDRESKEERTTQTKETMEEEMIRDDILRPRILDAIGRFAGITSAYLNSFDLTKGPDILFIVEDDALGDMLKLAIQWGSLKPSRPQKAMAIPDLFLTPAYEAELGLFWGEALANGKLSDIKIVLTAPEKDRKTGPKPFDKVPYFIQSSLGKGRTLASELTSIHLEGSFGVTDSTYYPKHSIFLNHLPNLTTLRLTNINLGVSVFQGERRLRTDMIAITCPNLIELHLVGCRLPFRSEVGTTRNIVIYYDAQSLLCYLTNTNSLADNKMRIQKLTVSAPQIHPMNMGRKHLWSFSNKADFLFLHLQYLDLSRHHLTWKSLETCFFAFGIKLRALILDGCVVDDFDQSAADISVFIDRHLPEKLQGSDPTTQERNRGATLESSTPEDDGWFVNCHNMMPDKMYFVTVYWAESKRETLKGTFTLVGY